MWEMIVWVLGTHVLALAGLIVRLRWQAVRDHRRQVTLRALAPELRGRGEVEIEEIRDDGSRLRVRVSALDPSRRGNRR